MSLDVYLIGLPETVECECQCGHKHMRQKQTTYYQANITHNLSRMADAAGIYEHLWRPDELGITKAGELITPLTEGLRRLCNDPEHFKTFDSRNGWGLYVHFVPFVQNYLEACRENPEATIEISR